MGLFSDIAGIFAGKADTHAAKNTITNYTTAGKQAQDQYSQSLDASRQINSPLYDVGLSGARGANAMLQPGYNFQSSDPSYQWRLQQGLNSSVNSPAAAAGSLNSGGTLKALNNYAQGAASQEFNNQFTRQNVMAGYAQPAANALTGSYYNTANGINNALFKTVEGVSGGDAAKAAGLGSQYGAFASLGNNVASMFGVPSGGGFNGTVAGGGGANPFSLSPNTLNSLPSF